ncbi:MAG TPA: VCBS repeat-containing protein, partial [bacterium]|nr:VCBS repeat-containing protein [bacterium]
MTRRLFFSIQILLFSVILAPLAAAQSGVGVGAFSVNGPKDQAYLSGAAQDAVVGALIKKGVSARTVGQTLDPDKLKNTAQGKGDDALLVAGRINIVGQTYRVLLKWVDSSGRVSQDYLEVASENQLLPSLESFAASRLQVPAAPAPAPVVTEALPAPKSKAEKTAPVSAPVPAPIPAAKPTPPEKVFKAEAEPAPAPAPAKVEKPAPRRESEPKVSNKVEPAASTQDYVAVSQRLPFEVRALAHADVDNDGEPEVLLTDQSDLYIYRHVGGDLQELGRFVGKKLDHFVKVDVMPAPQGGRPWIVLTNLRGNLAASKILVFEGGSVRVVHENIDYQLRVIRKDGV